MTFGIMTFGIMTFSIMTLSIMKLNIMTLNIKTLRCQYYKIFLSIIYATSSVFPYDFDCSYTDSKKITMKKVL